MFFWKQVPVSRLLIPLLAGIFVGLAGLLGNIGATFPLLTLLGVIAAFTFIKKLSIKHRWRWVFGLLLNIFIFLIGLQLVRVNNPLSDKSFYGNKLKNVQWIKVRLVDEPKVKGNFVRFTAEVQSLKSVNQWEQVTGQCLVYVSKDSKANNIHYGDVLLIKQQLLEIAPPKNPFQFDFKQYMAHKSIYYQCFLKSYEWCATADKQPNAIFKLSYYLRDRFLAILQAAFPKGEELAIAEALIAGYMDDVDAELMQVYANSGTLHVLSVSGLHVGAVFMVLSWFLGFMNRKTWLKLLKALILLIFLWMYALITGFSPSVMRSAVMLSLFVIAGVLGRSHNVFNTLTASALFLLVYNPYLIMDVGFQLSYTALFGLLYFQPAFYQLWEAPNRLLDEWWGIVTASVAAQLGTFPLALYYFHQFPNYFLLGNIPAILLSTFALYGGLALLLFHALPFISGLLQAATYLLIWALNKSIFFIDKLPYALTSGITCSVLEFMIWYLLIALCTAFVFNKQAKWLIGSLSLLIVIVSIHVNRDIQQLNQRKFIIYSINKTTAYDFVAGQEHVLFASANLLADKQKIKFNILNSYTQLGLSDNIAYNQLIHTDLSASWIHKKTSLIQFHNKLFYIADSSARPCSQLIDYFIISRGFKGNLADWKPALNGTKVIIDSSVPRYQSEKIKVQCRQLALDFIDVNTAGAYIQDF